MARVLYLALTLSAAVLPGVKASASTVNVCACDNTRVETVNSDYKKSKRPAADARLFKSKEVERQIARVKAVLTNRKLAWMFENCFPNTLDTTVHYRIGEDGKHDTFVYTGDIHAMWLRDSGAQVWPYVQLANDDENQIGRAHV